MSLLNNVILVKKEFNELNGDIKDVFMGNFEKVWG